ncbi:putative cupredoxin-like copper-binding protein [Mycoplana sp. BE70]|uniref:plastocyanin/azurin family copper-binding protein n=1 Tax=Mycoplana sp. BE70 TaxID=2817775 RepID=UPI0028548EF6|nr:plastocyanin/azurin family copper-binding protein [Mycoplana sp. BE70]MDR6757659.1 putative cupredoxin-like copper-binding protein [Mycoplana sp. BE70]
MLRFTRMLAVNAAAIALALSATPLLAANTIHVTATGEGGGSMALKLDQTSVAAGPATFVVHNDAMSEEHEVILVKLQSSDQKIPLVASKHRVDEKDLESLGEVEDLKPGADGKLDTDLAAGTYLLFCNLKGHYEAGMAAKLTVTP